MSKLNQLADLGQAVWFDYIRRSFVASGSIGVAEAPPSASAWPLNATTVTSSSSSVDTVLSGDDG